MARSFVPLVAVLVSALLVGCPADKTTTVTTTYIYNVPVTIVTQAIPAGEDGISYVVQVFANGGSGTFDWSIASGGTNDSWLNVDSNGILSGTPTVAQIGFVRILIRAQDQENPDNFDMATYTFNVTESSTPPAFGFETTSLPNAWTYISFYEYLEAQGGSGNYTFLKLPSGTNDNWINVYTSGYVSGWPQASNEGPVSLVVRVFDVDTPSLSVSTTFTFTVFDSGMVILNADPLPNAALGMNYQVQIRMDGGSGSYIYYLEPGGSNDSWLSIDSSGLLQGTAPGLPADVAVRVGVSDAENLALYTQREFNFKIKNIAISTEYLPNAYLGHAYSNGMTSQGGGGSITWSIQPGGTNYSWLQMTGSTLGSITTPGTSDLGGVSVIVEVTDGTYTDARVFNFIVHDQVVISPTTLADANVGVGYSVTVPTQGGSGNFVFSRQTGGSNDGWLSLDASTGMLSGTPDSSDLGPVSIVIKVEESLNSAVFDQQTLTFDVNGVEITTIEVADASNGQAYSHFMTAMGGSGFYAWSLTGSAPAWISIDPDSGELQGTPATNGLVTINVYVYDPLDPLLNDTKTFVFLVVGTIFKEDFESSSGWSRTYDWEIGRRDASLSPDRYYGGPYKTHSGQNCAGTDLNHFPYTYISNWTNYRLESPVFNIPSGANAILTFWQWVEMSPGDGGKVEVYDPSTTTWMPLTPTTPTYNGAAGGQNCYWGHPRMGYDNGWQKVVADLTAYAGQNGVRLRWICYTQAYMVGYGYYIDDVHVFDLGTTPPQPLAVKKPTPGDGWTYAPSDSTIITSGLNLSWDGTVGGASYDVYFGNSQSAVASATTSSAEYAGNQVITIFTTTSLVAGNTYYWRVDARNSAGVTAGPVWEFTVVNPVPVVINEIQIYGSSSLGSYIELRNPSTAVHQDISNWQLTMYYNGNVNATFTIPLGLIMTPDSCKVFSEYYHYYHGYYPYRRWECCTMNVSLSWYWGYYNCECVLQDFNGNGKDYWGVNVTTSNCPTDLTWTGSLTQGSSSYSLHRRRTGIDTDSASDWRIWYRYYYGSSYGYMGLKDPGQ